MKVHANGKCLTKEPVELISVTGDNHECFVRIDKNLIIIEGIDVEILSQTIFNGKMKIIIRTKVE